MKTWTTPAAIAQQFAANDTVSACKAIINCNVPLEEGFGYYHHAYPEAMETNGGGTRTHGYYSPCGAIHETSANGELVPHTFYKGYKPDANGKYNTNIQTDLSAPVNCYVWYVYTEDGLLDDVHATLDPSGVEVNKS